jgi:hypothetical protein
MCSWSQTFFGVKFKSNAILEKAFFVELEPFTQQTGFCDRK